MSHVRVIEFIYGLEDGGAETLVKDYVRLMDSNKFKPSIVVIRASHPTANLRIVNDANIPLFRIFPRWNLFSKAVYLLFGKWYVPYKLCKIIQHEKPHVLHVHMENLKYVQRIGKALDGVRLFYTCHNLPELYFSGKNIKEYYAAKSLIKHNNLQLIALHNDMAKELNEMFGINNTVVIRNGIDFKRFKDITINKEEERTALGIPQDAFVIGHVGRFMEQKNHPFLVEVFNEAAKRNDKAFLLMVGAGDTAPIEAKLREYGLADRYMILSHRTDVNEIMRAMDVFVFPSLFEGLGIVMIEAQVSGLRCVASDQVPEEAFKTENAISLPLGDAEKWAEVILDDTIRNEYRSSLDEYDMNKEIKRLEKLYSGEWNFPTAGKGE